MPRGVMPSNDPPSHDAAIVGGGPAGLMAAQGLAAAGLRVELYDAMPTVGRKFLLAGKGGLNLTHSEGLEAFLARYGPRRVELEPHLASFGPRALRDWAADLGVTSVVGSSGRVFPAGMAAAPLLRAWLRRLRSSGVRFHLRHRWLGFAQAGAGGQALRFAAPGGEVTRSASVVILALGGGSWARLGSDGAWVAPLRQSGVDVAPLRPSNCGFDVDWSEHFRSRFAGHAVKSVSLRFTDASGDRFERLGEFVITDTGIEGGLVYAVSARLRDALEAKGPAVVHLDLLPGRSQDALAAQAARPRGSRSLANHLRGRLGLRGVKAALLRERLPREELADAERLARSIKALPLAVVAPRPLDEAISTAGGVRFEALDPGLMLRARPGVFCAGEMLDWEAPTGGYLLTGCFATGFAAARGARHYLSRRSEAAQRGAGGGSPAAGGAAKPG